MKKKYAVGILFVQYLEGEYKRKKGKGKKKIKVDDKTNRSKVRNLEI